MSEDALIALMHDNQIIGLHFLFIAPPYSCSAHLPIPFSYKSDFFRVNYYHHNLFFLDEKYIYQFNQLKPFSFLSLTLSFGMSGKIPPPPNKVP